MSYQCNAFASALDCKEKVGPLFEKKSERCTKIWGIVDSLQGLASEGAAMASFVSQQDVATFIVI